MHAQIRTVPAQSPADLKKFLQVLVQKDILAVALTGSKAEQGGDVAFGLRHSVDGDRTPYDDALAKLSAEGYSPRLVDVEHPGFDADPRASIRALIKAVDKARAENPKNRIRDFFVGVDANGNVQLQITSDPIG